MSSLRHGSLHRLTALALAALSCMASGCGSSPWEQGTSSETEATASARELSHEFFADDAKFSVWLDERASGSQIRHGMLVVHEPELAPSNGHSRGRFVITSRGPELHAKVSDIVADRIPVSAGMKTNFALGRAIPVRVERIDFDGKRQLVCEGPVAFLELTR